MAWTRMLVGVLLLLIGAGTAFPEEASPASRPVPESLQGLSLEEVLQLANAWGMNSEENKVISFVTGREIHLQFPDGPNIVYPLPPDRMLVAIAPYIRKTHGCSTHYPSSCLGELPNTAVRATVAGADGVPVLDIKTFTLSNGFLELWLPRNGEYELRIEARGLKASGLVSTTAEAITCITTVQLHP